MKKERTEKMATSKASKEPENPEDIDALRSELASFASSIGLSSAPSSLPNSGFNDSDFRKTGPLKPPKPQKSPKPQNPKEPSKPPKPKPFNEETQKFQNKNTKNPNMDRKENGLIDKAKAPPVSTDSKSYDRWKNLPKLPLVKASALGVWHVDAAELEEKVFGTNAGEWKVTGKEGKRIEVKNAKALGERLLAQYAQDFDKSRGNSGDMKMLIATQRSGTAIDKVSAYSVMVGENPIANIKSLDALLAMVTSKVGKRHALTGFEALKELFLSSLLPDRKLKSLKQRSVNHLPESKDGYSLLLFWYWEECLKQRCAQIIPIGAYFVPFSECIPFYLFFSFLYAWRKMTPSIARVSILFYLLYQYDEFLFGKLGLLGWFYYEENDNMRCSTAHVNVLESHKIVLESHKNA